MPCRGRNCLPLHEAGWWNAGCMVQPELLLAQQPRTASGQLSCTTSNQAGIGRTPRRASGCLAWQCEALSPAAGACKPQTLQPQTPNPEPLAPDKAPAGPRGLSAGRLKSGQPCHHARTHPSVHVASTLPFFWNQILAGLTMISIAQEEGSQTPTSGRAGGASGPRSPVARCAVRRRADG